MTPSQDEVGVIRTGCEVAVVATIEAIMSDAEAIHDHLARFDFEMPTLKRVIGTLTEAAASVRCVRDELDMTVRADAYERLSSVGE